MYAHACMCALWSAVVSCCSAVELIYVLHRHDVFLSGGVTSCAIYIPQAEKAEVVSRQQLALAAAMGNPVMVATCKVYLALSLMQQGQLLHAGRSIR